MASSTLLCTRARCSEVRFQSSPERWSFAVSSRLLTSFPPRRLSSVSLVRRGLACVSPRIQLLRPAILTLLVRLAPLFAQWEAESAIKVVVLLQLKLYFSAILLPLVERVSRTTTGSAAR